MGRTVAALVIIKEGLVIIKEGDDILTHNPSMPTVTAEELSLVRRHMHILEDGSDVPPIE